MSINYYHPILLSARQPPRRTSDSKQLNSSVLVIISTFNDPRTTNRDALTFHPNDYSIPISNHSHVRMHIDTHALLLQSQSHYKTRLHMYTYINTYIHMSVCIYACTVHSMCITCLSMYSNVSKNVIMLVYERVISEEIKT